MQAHKNPTQPTKDATSISSAQTKVAISKGEGLVKESASLNGKQHSQSVNQFTARNSRFANFRPFSQHQGSTQDARSKASSNLQANTSSKAAGRSAQTGITQLQTKQGLNLQASMHSQFYDFTLSSFVSKAVICRPECRWYEKLVGIICQRLFSTVEEQQSAFAFHSLVWSCHCIKETKPSRRFRYLTNRS